LALTLLSQLIVVLSCSSHKGAINLRSGSDEYITDILLSFSADSLYARARLLSPAANAFEQEAGEMTGEFERVRKAVTGGYYNSIQPQSVDWSSLDEDQSILSLIKVLLALHHHDLPVANDYLKTHPTLNRKAENSLEMFACVVKASFHRDMGEYVQAFNELAKCDSLLLQKTTPDLKLVISSDAIAMGRICGYPEIALSEFGKLRDTGGNQFLLANFDSEYAMSLVLNDNNTSMVNEIFVKSIQPSILAGKALPQNLDCIRAYLDFSTSKGQLDKAVPYVNSLCQANVLSELEFQKPDRFSSFVMAIYNLYRDGRRIALIDLSIKDWIEGYFSKSENQDGYNYRRYQSLNTGDLDMESKIFEDENLSVKNEKLGLVSTLPGLEGLRYNAVLRFSKGRTRANARIRGLSPELMDRLGLNGLNDMDAQSESTESTSNDLSKWIRQQFTTDLTTLGDNGLKVDEVNAMIESYLAYTYSAYQRSKGDQDMKSALKAIQVQVTTNNRHQMDRFFRNRTNDPEYKTYLQLKSACNKAEEQDMNVTRAGSGRDLKIARENFIRFITDREKQIDSQLARFDSLNLLKCNEKNVMIYYGGKEHAYLLSKIGESITMKELALPDNFEEDMSFVLTSGMDINSVKNDPTVATRFKSIRKSWNERFVKDYWPEVNSEVVLIPIGNFAFINWEYIEHETPAGIRPLIMDYEIRYEPDVNSLFEPDTPVSEEVSMAGFTSDNFPPLPAEIDGEGNVIRSVSMNRLDGALEEVNAICNLYNGIPNTKTTPSLFLNECERYNVLLISTHGIVTSNNGLHSTSLLFDKDPTEKFMVNQEEMLERKLNADLIAVPSCNSGLGEVSADGGLYSISGAMLQAGAKSVVSSVHELPDKSTSLITRSFFDNLHAGMKKSEALRKAKLDFLFENGSSKSHPVYWAGLILIGDNLPLSNIIHRPSDGKEYFSFVVAAIASLIVLVVFAIIRKRRRVA
jgi:hypothetical protein